MRSFIWATISGFCSCTLILSSSLFSTNFLPDLQNIGISDTYSYLKLRIMVKLISIFSVINDNVITWMRLKVVQIYKIRILNQMKYCYKMPKTPLLHIQMKTAGHSSDLMGWGTFIWWNSWVNYILNISSSNF